MDNSLLHNEKELLREIAEDDQAAFKVIFDYYQGKLFSAAIDLTHSFVVAEELVQDVFLKIWLKRKELPSINSFSSYLFTMLRNEAYDWLTKRARQRTLLKQMEPGSISSIDEKDDFLREQEFAALLQQALAQLPVQQREVFRLMRLEGFTREQTAITLGIDPNTVKTHMSRALKNIRAWCIAHKELYLLVFLLFS